MTQTVNIGSSAEWQRVLASSSVVVTDFYADWCGPCKMIAPTFESLSARHSKAKKVTFCKVNVDHQRDVAQQYGVRAMPTFLILRDGAVVDTIQGANPPALTAAVEKAVKLVRPTFSSDGGHRLGGSPATTSRPTISAPFRWSLGGFINAIVTFFGLYFVSLFSFDPYKAAENSRFNKKNPPPRQTVGARKPGAARPAFKTLADLGD